MCRECTVRIVFVSCVCIRLVCTCYMLLLESISCEVLPLYTMSTLSHTHYDLLEGRHWKVTSGMIIQICIGTDKMPERLLNKSSHVCRLIRVSGKAEHRSGVWVVIVEKRHWSLHI